MIYKRNLVFKNKGMLISKTKLDMCSYNRYASRQTHRQTYKEIETHRQTNE